MISINICCRKSTGAQKKLCQYNNDMRCHREIALLDFADKLHSGAVVLCFEGGNYNL